MSMRSYLIEHLPSWAYVAVQRSLRVLPSHQHYHARTVRIERALGIDHERIVRGGPFSGMRYIGNSIGSSLSPKIIGSYELELHETIDRLLDCAPIEVIVDVGCAEGYYAVGLARRCPQAVVFAYDSSPHARALCRRMALLNGVADRVHVRNRITTDQLRMVLTPGALLICDCEGYEQELINPMAVPELAMVTAIIELHDFYDPSISTAIVDRCAGSHRVELLNSQAREPSMFEELLAPLALEDRTHALDEGRPGPMQWAVMTPRAIS